MIWQKYEKCKNYTDTIGLNNDISEQWDFFLDKQWNQTQGRQIQTGGVILPFFNIIKPSIKFQLSTIAQNSFVPTFKDTTGEQAGLVTALNNLLAKEWRVGKQKARSWKIIKNGLIEGDSYQFCGTDNPNDDQIISSTNIFFGDEGNTNIQDQPYIMIRERLLLSDVKDKALKNGIPKDLVRNISADKDKSFVINDETENDIEDKVISILYLEKKDGVVYMARAVKDLIYEPLTPVAIMQENKILAGMKNYPIASFIPEEQPNKARGKSAVRAMIPNQIEINKTLVRRSEAVKIAAYPRIVYNGNVIDDEDDLDKAGVKIRVDGIVDNVKQQIDYLNPMSQSSDAMNLQKDMIQTTREVNGSVDAITGASDPTRVSGSAVIAMREQSALPLNEPVDKYKQFIEDLAIIWLEQKIVYAPKGINIDGTDYPLETLKNLQVEVNIDVSQDTPWTKQAEQSFLDSLLEKQRITLGEYIDLSPDNGVVPKGKMKKMLQERENQNGEIPQVPVQQ